MAVSGGRMPLDLIYRVFSVLDAPHHRITSRRFAELDNEFIELSGFPLVMGTAFGGRHVLFKKARSRRFPLRAPGVST